MSSCIAILGSTGSIGTQTIEVATSLGIRIAALAAGRNVELLASQIIEHRPRLASVADQESAKRLKALLSGADGDLPEILWGEEDRKSVV